MKCTRQNCVDCGKDLGLKLNTGKLRRCRLCRTKLLQRDPSQNSTYGLKHVDREKFRKNSYPNVNYNDRIVEYSPAGNSRKKYRMSCSQCGSDRGYQTHVDAL